MVTTPSPTPVLGSYVVNLLTPCSFFVITGGKALTGKALSVSTMDEQLLPLASETLRPTESTVIGTAKTPLVVQYSSAKVLGLRQMAIEPVVVVEEVPALSGKL